MADSSTFAAQGHTIGRLLLHGLQGEDRERERSNLNTVSVRAERNLHTQNKDLLAHPESEEILFAAEALPAFGAHGLARRIGKPVLREAFCHPTVQSVPAICNTLAACAVSWLSGEKCRGDRKAHSKGVRVPCRDYRAYQGLKDGPFQLPCSGGRYLPGAL